jgi:hypothetical protein
LKPQFNGEPITKPQDISRRKIMEDNLPQPTFVLTTPAAGWFKAPSAIGSDQVFLRVSDDLRLAAVGLFISSIGWALNHNAQNGWVPAPAVHGGQLTAAPRELLVRVSEALVGAGLWLPLTIDGLDGFVVAGAAVAVQERFARQANASKAGQTSQQNQGSRFTSQRFPAKPNKPDPDAKVDWSRVSEEL